MTPAAMESTILPLWKGLLSCWDAWLLTLVLAAVVPVYGCVRFRRRGDAQAALSGRAKAVFYGRVSLSQWLLVAAMVWIARRHGLSVANLGEQAGEARLTAGVTVGLLSIVAVVWAVVRWRVRRARPEKLAASLGRLGKLAPAFGVEMAAFVVLCITAGVCEELLYRGWLVNILRVATGSVWVAVGVGALVFGIAHAYQGIQGMLRAGFVGLQLAVLFVFAGSLIPGQVLHAAVDLLVGYAAATARERASLSPRGAASARME